MDEKSYRVQNILRPFLTKRKELNISLLHLMPLRNLTGSLHHETDKKERFPQQKCTLERKIYEKNKPTKD